MVRITSNVDCRSFTETILRLAHITNQEGMQTVNLNLAGLLLPLRLQVSTGNQVHWHYFLSHYLKVQFLITLSPDGSSPLNVYGTLKAVQVVEPL